MTTQKDPASAREHTSLRPERIQLHAAAGDGSAGEPLPAEPAGRLLDGEQVQQALAELPDWALTADAGAIERSFHYPVFSALVLALNLVTSLAGLTGSYPDIDVRNTRLTLRLPAAGIGGLTAADLQLARIVDTMSELGRAR
jgi:4a-hydroxytetrahydrobiopterin dehydratase